MLRPERRWYRGDLHVHSEQSGDATATLDDIFALAPRQDLGFANLSDHNTVAQHALAAAYLQTHSELLLLRGAEIGDDVDGVDRVQLAAHVTGGAGTFVQLWRDGVQIDQAAITSDDATIELADTPGAGDFRYRVEVIDGAGRRVLVTSHFYVHAIGAPEGCGAGGDLGSAVVLATVLPWRRRRRRRPHAS